MYISQFHLRSKNVMTVNRSPQTGSLNMYDILLKFMSALEIIKFLVFVEFV